MGDSVSSKFSMEKGVVVEAVTGLSKVAAGRDVRNEEERDVHLGLEWREQEEVS